MPWQLGHYWWHLIQAAKCYYSSNSVVSDLHSVSVWWTGVMVILTEMCRDIPQYPDTNSGILSRLGHKLFL